MPTSEDFGEADRLQRDSDLLEVMRTPAGRRLIARIIYRTAGIKAVSYSADLGETKFFDGQRSVGKAIEEELERVCPLQRDEMEIERIRLERQRAPDPVPHGAERQHP